MGRIGAGGDCLHRRRRGPRAARAGASRTYAMAASRPAAHCLSVVMCSRCPAVARFRAEGFRRLFPQGAAHLVSGDTGRNARSAAGSRQVMAWLVGRRGVVLKQVIVGANRLGCELAERLAEGPGATTVLGLFDDRRPQRLTMSKAYRLLGRLADLPGYVRRHNVQVIYICLPVSAQPRIRALLEDLRDTTASIYFVPDLFAFDLIQARFGQVKGVPVVAICETPFCGLNGVLKRGSDIVLAALGLLLTAPLMVAIAIAVKRSSPGPILFRQRRYGLQGEEFVVYKFRTMKVCEDGARDSPGSPGRPACYRGRASPAPQLAGRTAAALQRTAGDYESGGAATARRRAQRALSQARQRLHAASQSAARESRAGHR